MKIGIMNKNFQILAVPAEKKKVIYKFLIFVLESIVYLNIMSSRLCKRKEGFSYVSRK